MSDDAILANLIRELNAEVTALRFLMLFVLAESDIPDNPVDRFRQTIQARLDDGTVTEEWVDQVQATIRSMLSAADQIKRY